MFLPHFDQLNERMYVPSTTFRLKNEKQELHFQKSDSKRGLVVASRETYFFKVLNLRKIEYSKRHAQMKSMFCLFLFEEVKGYLALVRSVSNYLEEDSYTTI
jgi:hypothetical protein